MAIDEKLNLKPIADTDALKEIKPAPPPKIIKNAPSLSEQDKIDDIQYARVVLKDTIAKTSDILNDAIMMAKTEASPRAYEAVSEIVDKITNMATKLVDIHKTVGDIEKTKHNEQNHNTGNTNILIATTNDIVEKLKEIKEKNE